MVMQLHSDLQEISFETLLKYPVREVSEQEVLDLIAIAPERDIPIDNIEDIFESSESLATLAYKRIKNLPNHAEITNGLFEKLHMLYSNPELAPAIESKNLAGYLKVLEAADELVLMGMDLDKTNPSDRAANAYTNGEVSLLRHLVTSSYLEGCLASMGSADSKNEIWKISLTDSLLLTDELYILKNDIERILEDVTTDPTLRAKYEKRRSVILKALFQSQSLISDIGRDCLDSKEEPDKLLELEKVIASTALYYAEVNIHNADPRHRGIIKRAKGDEYYFLRGIIAGTRSETISYGYLSDSVEKINNLIGHENDVAFLDQADPEGDYSQFLSLARAFLPKGYDLGRIGVQKVPDDFDRYGIADFVIFAEPKDKDSTFKPRPLLYIDVKTEQDINLKDNLIVVSGAVPELDATTQSFSAKSLLTEEDTIKGTPRSAHWFIEEYGLAVASMRIPGNHVYMPYHARDIKEPSSSFGARQLSGVKIGSRSDLVHGKDIRWMLENGTENKAKLIQSANNIMTMQLDANRDLHVAQNS